MPTLVQVNGLWGVINYGSQSNINKTVLNI